MAGPRVGNRYELQRRLEQRDGILSFEGWDSEQQRDVLVLLMRASGGGTAEEQTRLLQFARLAGLAGTETDYALPAILDSGSDPPDQNGETSYYLIAELLSGTSLDSKLPLEPERAVAAVRDIGEGLRWARQRFAGATPTYDLDPARIVLDDEGKARLTTFGLPGLGGEEGEQNDVLALGNLLRTLLAGGASNEARSLSAAQALALAQVIGRSTASTSSRYANIPAFLDALQAALEGRQTPDPKFTPPPRRTAPFNAAAAALASIPTPAPTTQAAEDAASDAALPPPLTVSPIPDELADAGDEDDAEIASTVPSAPPSMGPLPQSTSTLVDAAEFTPPAPTNGNGATPPQSINEPPSIPPERFSSLRRITPPNGQPSDNAPSAAPDDPTAAFTPIPYTSPPLPRSGATSNSFFDTPRSDAPDIAEVGKAVNKRQPMLRPAPRLIDPQTGQLRGELYVAGSKRSTGVMATLTNNNRILLYLGIIVVILILLLLLAAINNKGNQQGAVINPTPVARLTATVAEAVLVASPTAARLATATSVAIVAPFTPTATLPSPTAVAAAPPTTCNVSLGDVPPSDPDYGPISRMVCNGAFYPVPGGLFQKNTPVTRAEIAHAVVAAMGWEADANAANPFTDVNANTPYFNDIITAIEHGVMSGVAADKFSPNAPVSRIQAVRVVVKAAGWPPADPGTAQHYVDVSPQGSGSNPTPLFIYVEAAYAHGVIGPTPGDKFSPNDPASRKDAAIMLNNMLNTR